jgi:hypothetical protein
VDKIEFYKSRDEKNGESQDISGDNRCYVIMADVMMYEKQNPQATSDYTIYKENYAEESYRK